MGNILHMISGPRNMSTAIMYAFDNRPDTVGIDEPFYAHYLFDHPEVDHPGRDEIIASMSRDPATIINMIQTKATDMHVFVKNMAHHIERFDYSFMYEIKNIFLIRDPLKLIRSFIKVMPDPTMQDIGIRQEYQLYQDLIEHGAHTIVVDADRLLSNPHKILEKLCLSLEIPYDTSMLSWNAGPRDIDGVWASYWYANVHQTSGFSPRITKDQPIDKKYDGLLSEARPYYRALLDDSISL